MDRPKINPPLRTIDLILEGLAGLCIAYVIFQLIVEFPGLEQKIPTHFNGAGEPDNWGNKHSLLILPIVNIAMYAGLTVMNRYPYIFNYPITITEQNVIRQYQLAKTLVSAIKFSVAAMFLYIQIQTINAANGSHMGLGKFFIVVVIVGSFVPMIIYFIAASKHK